MGATGNKLTVKICNKNPVELIDFTECLLGVGNQYVRFLAKNPDIAEAKDVKLFVKEIRSGSIITDLIPLLPIALPPLLDHIDKFNSVIEFTVYVKLFTDSLLGKGEKPQGIEKIDYEQFDKILNPVARDRTGTMEFNGIVNGGVHITQVINNIEANAMQNSISKELKLLKEPTERTQKKVLLYWYQARNDQKSKAGDRAIIESISKSPIRTIFAIDSLKHEMLFDSYDNPFHYAYIVDVIVDTIQDRPAIYKIIEFHEKITKPAEGTDSQQGKLFTT